MHIVGREVRFSWMYIFIPLFFAAVVVMAIYAGPDKRASSSHKESLNDYLLNAKRYAAVVQIDPENEFVLAEPIQVKYVSSYLATAPVGQALDPKNAIVAYIIDPNVKKGDKVIVYFVSNWGRVMPERLAPIDTAFAVPLSNVANDKIKNNLK